MPQFTKNKILYWILIGLPFIILLVWFYLKVFQFQYLNENFVDAIIALQLSRGWLEGRPLLFDTYYGYHWLQFPNACAIPTGRYALVLDFSPKFNKTLIELTGVKGFTETKFHAGNTPTDTAGCLLTGLDRRNDEVRFSNQALEYLHRCLEPVFKNESVFLTINRDAHAIPYRR